MHYVTAWWQSITVHCLYDDDDVPVDRQCGKLKYQASFNDCFNIENVPTEALSISEIADRIQWKLGEKGDDYLQIRTPMEFNNTVSVLRDDQMLLYNYFLVFIN